LAHVEEDLACSITDHFDLIAGTSTGAIIAVGLGLGLHPREIVDFYLKHGPKIFPASGYAQKLASIRHLFRRKFDSNTLEQSLRECFGERFLGESTKRLVVPSFDVGRNDVCLFKTPHHPRLARDHKLKAWQVAMSSAAAPSYFPAVRSIESRRLVDGGVWANNPVLVAITEAKGVLGVPLENIRVLSLGTTDPVQTGAETLDSGGLWTWRRDAVRVAFRGQSIGATNQAKLLLGDQNVLRIDPVVPDGVFKLDQIDAARHLALAAHESRNAMPKIAVFMREHRATPFEPFHGPNARKIEEARS
jgi:patatin-like phospholipase/acyl hydrolase